MKKNIAIVLAAMTFALIGCEKNIPYEPGQPATTTQFVYFPVTAHMGVELNPEDSITSHSFVIARRDSSKAESIGLEVILNSENVFTLPDKVDFAANEGHKTLTAKFGKMEVGETYSFTIRVKMTDINPYAVDTATDGSLNFPAYTYEATLIKYEFSQGIFVDDAVMPLIGLPEGLAWTVEYKMANLPSGITKLILLNPYTTPVTGEDPETGVYIGCPFTDVEGLEVDDTKDYNMYFVIDEEGYITVEDFDLGIIYSGVGMLSILNYGGETSYGYFEPDFNAVVFDADDQDNNSVFYVGPYAQNYCGFRFFMSPEDYLASLKEEGEGGEAEAPARAPKLNKGYENYLFKTIIAKEPKRK